MYVVKDLVPDMTLFYEQYASVQPWLQKDEKLELGAKQIHQSTKEREKLVSLHMILNIGPFSFISHLMN